MGDSIETCSDLVQRIIPGNGDELATALRTASPEGGRQSISVISTLDVPIHLGAQKTLGERVIGIARDRYGPAVFDRCQRRTGVRAVVGARAANDCGHSLE